MILKTNAYKHQKEAFNKLSPLKVNALYAEMGTGKTRMALDLVAHRINNNRITKVRWFCPCSVKTNLEMDLKKHVPVEYLNIFTIAGIESLSSSDRLYDAMLKSTSENVYTIVDESNLIKNHTAIRTQRLVELSKLCRYKSILNGTPITKNEKDLFSQWFFLDPRILGYQSFWSFAANHLEYDPYIPGKINRVLNTDYLSRKIAPYTFQVLKKDCLDLPQKNYSEFWFSLVQSHQEHYAEMVESFLNYINEREPATVYRMLTAAQLIIAGRRITTSPRRSIKHESFYDNLMDNPRLQALSLQLQYVSDKTIIWTKYQFEMEDIATMLRMDYPCSEHRMYNGNMSLKERANAIYAFETDPAVRFLIINKNCGQYGLNLQFCHIEIFYSNDFNYGSRSQAEDRIHRIGQDKDCQIIDLWAARTIDNMIDKNLSRKGNLLDAFNECIQALQSGDLKNKLLGGA